MRFRNDVDRPSGWKRLESSKWFCFKCKENIPGNSNELIYVADMDYFYHIHIGKSSFRVLKVKQTKKGLRVSLPGVEFDRTDPSTLAITGITAHTIDTPNLSQYSSTLPKKKQQRFQTINDTERIKSVIESHPSGISRKNIARELGMSTSRVGKLVREILDSDSKYQEVKDGKESLVRTESTLDRWKLLKSAIE
jgi:hypothetical protein